MQIGHGPAVGVSVGGGSGVGVSTCVGTAVTVGVRVAIGVDVAVIVEVARGVTVGGPTIGVGVGKRVVVANGVRVTVDVAVGSGVPGVMVGVVVSVGILVRVGDEIMRGLVRVGPGPVCGVSWVSSKVDGPSVPRGVEVGRPLGESGPGVRSHAASVTRNAAMTVVAKAIRTLRGWPRNASGARKNVSIRQNYNIFVPDV